MKFSKQNTILIIVTAIVFFVSGYLMLTFPASFIWDMYWEPIDAEDIERLNHNPWRIAGLPAGEGIQVLETREQFDSIHFVDEFEFYTFETDSIIPLNVFHMKSGLDAANETYRVGGRYQRNTGRQWPTWAHSFNSIWTRRNIYNRYYLVKLPDGNYVLAYLDDGYYLKYLINRLQNRKVQLPVGYVDTLGTNEKKELQYEMEKHGMDENRYLVMFNKTRYEENKGSYQDMLLLIYVGMWVVYFVFAAIILQLIKRKKGKAKHEK